MNTVKTIKDYSIAALAALATSAAAFAADAAAPAAPAAEAKEAEQPKAWNERESLFLEGAVEKYAPDSGFTPSITWTGEAWGNASNGSDFGGLVNSLFTFGIEQDLEAATGVKNAGRIGVSAFYYNRSKGDLRGLDSSQGGVSNILVDGDVARVFEIYYANEFETKAGDFGFRVGQLAADEDFMGMDYSDIFLNSSLGAIPNVAPAQMFSQYNVATFGLVAYYTYGDFDVTLGVYNGNVGADKSSNNGFDYAHTFDTVAFWYQFGYNYAVSDLKGRVVFGGNYHSDPSKVNFDEIDDHNFYSFFVGIQQDFVNDSEGNAKLGGFVRLGLVPSSKSSDQNFYADFGLNWFAPIPGRDDDVFAVAFSVIENERTSRDEYSHYEGMLEVTYRCQLTPAIAIQPDFQFYTNPNNGGSSAYIIGARAEVNF